MHFGVGATVPPYREGSGGTNSGLGAGAELLHVGRPEFFIDSLLHFTFGGQHAISDIKWIQYAGSTNDISSHKPAQKSENLNRRRRVFC